MHSPASSFGLEPNGRDELYSGHSSHLSSFVKHMGSPEWSALWAIKSQSLFMFENAQALKHSSCGATKFFERKKFLLCIVEWHYIYIYNLYSYPLRKLHKIASFWSSFWLDLESEKWKGHCANQQVEATWQWSSDNAHCQYCLANAASKNYCLRLCLIWHK